MTYKIIVSGHLEFGNARSFDRMTQSYQQRLETYYRNDVFLKQEDIFPAGATVLSIPRLTVQAGDKTWRNTVSILELVVQYAVAGSISMWKLDNGLMLEHMVLEPRCDKFAVQSFLLGRELLTEGKQGEAKEALSQAIEKFERHGLAYERRGHVNFLLNNLEDAIYDFSKSIDLNPNNPDAFVGRALVRMTQRQFATALEDLEMALKSSIPHQPIYWKARRLKGESHLEREEYALAEQELRLFSKRVFKKDDPNLGWRRKALHNFGRALFGLSKFQEAADAFQQAVEIESGKDNLSLADRLHHLELALQKTGKEEARKDLNAAASLGSEKTARMLASAGNV
ncbi:MAG: tetratricopeptide repeat protein [Haliscomenobacter sp.]|nr:tetratricopeptide repeat protein [Haliscomenobacter sp.]